MWREDPGGSRCWTLLLVLVIGSSLRTRTTPAAAEAWSTTAGSFVLPAVKGGGSRATMPKTTMACSQPHSTEPLLEEDSSSSTATPTIVNRRLATLRLGRAAVLAMLVAASASSPLAAHAAADFAGQDISGQDFSGQDLSNRDFTSANAQQTNFRNANLQGAIFTKANLVRADFTGANLRNAQLMDAILDGSNWKDVTAERAVFSASILDIGTLENADLTETLWPSKLRIMICDMTDILKGTNPKTGVATFESVMCDDYTRKS